MSQEPCAVLTAVFPIVLLTVVVEHRAVHVRIRRTRIFRQGSLAAATASYIGLVLTVVGVQTEGLEGAPAVFRWLAGLVAVASLMLAILAALATTEAEEDAEAPAQ